MLIIINSQYFVEIGQNCLIFLSENQHFFSVKIFDLLFSAKSQCVLGKHFGFGHLWASSMCQGDFFGQN